MNRATQGIVLIVVGYVTIYLATFGGYLAFLKPGMRLPMSAAGLMLLILGGLTVRPAVAAFLGDDDDGPEAEGRSAVTRDRRDDSLSHHGDGHHGPSVGWLLMLPLIALALVRPDPLGADAARRDIGRTLPPRGDVDFGPLPAPTNGAVELPLSTFVARAQYDRDNGMAGVTFRLTGFVMRDPAIDDGYLLARFTLACCAADAFASQVEVRGLTGPPPPDDTWVVVVADWSPPPGRDTRDIETRPAVHVRSQTVIDAPDNAYE